MISRWDAAVQAGAEVAHRRRACRHRKWSVYKKQQYAELVAVGATVGTAGVSLRGWFNTQNVSFGFGRDLAHYPRS